MKHTEIIYIASPYTSRRESEAERGAEQHARFTIVTRYAAALMREGWPVFSPITHGHPIWLASLTQLDASAEAWASVNTAMMRQCESCHVLAIKGWNTSRGVRAERDWFEENIITPQIVPLPACWFNTEILRVYCQLREN